MLDRIDRENASRKVGEYYSPKPHELALKKQEEPFQRAKSEVISYMRRAIDNVEKLTFEEFAIELKGGRVMQSVAAITPFWAESDSETSSTSAQAQPR